LSRARADLRSLELPSRDQPPPNRLREGLDLQLRRDRTVDDHVNERSQWRGDTHVVNGSDVRLAESGVMQAERSRNRGHPLEAWRDRHVQLRRHRIGEFVQCQRRRVAEHTLGLVLPIAGPKLPDDQIRP
jgi:hypothetical protein